METRSVERVEIQRLNETYIRVLSSMGVAAELRDKFSFFVDGYQHMPRYKCGYWDGKIYLFDMRTRTMYAGLEGKVREFCAERRYDLVAPEEEVCGWNVDEVVKSLNLSITPRDYQYDAFANALNAGRSITLMPTSSGKTLVEWMLARHAQNCGERTLVIEPKLALVSQTVKAFEGYGSPSYDIQKISGGLTSLVERPIVVATWQSIHRLPKEWINQFGMIEGDEVHRFKAKCLCGMMEAADTVGLRHGFTGTLKDSQTDKLILEGLFGTPYAPKMADGVETKTVELMKRGYVSPLEIVIIILEYPDEERKSLAASKRALKRSAAAGSKRFAIETDFLNAHEGRNRFIANLAKDSASKGNSLMLFSRVDKHGAMLHERVKGMGVNAYFVAGRVGADEREHIRQIVAKEKDALITASLGTFQEGVDIPSIEKIIFTASSKAKIQILQSIGRGGRLHERKTKCTLYDVADDLTWKGKPNYAMEHMEKRIALYAREEFDYRTVRVKLKPGSGSVS